MQHGSCLLSLSLSDILFLDQNQFSDPMETKKKKKINKFAENEVRGSI